MRICPPWCGLAVCGCNSCTDTVAGAIGQAPLHIADGGSWRCQATSCREDDCGIAGGTIAGLGDEAGTPDVGHRVRAGGAAGDLRRIASKGPAQCKARHYCQPMDKHVNCMCWVLQTNTWYAAVLCLVFQCIGCSAVLLMMVAGDTPTWHQHQQPSGVTAPPSAPACRYPRTG